MTCSLSQTWASDYISQVDYIENIQSALSEIDLNTRTVVMHQATEPTQSEMVAAWEEETETSAAIPVGATFQWFNPNTGVIEQIYKTTYDLGALLSSGVIRPHTEKDDSMDWVFLGEAYLDVDNSGDVTVVSGLPQTYTHLFTTFCLRSTTAALTTGLAIRLNGQIGATQNSQALSTDGAAWAAAATLGATSLLETGMMVGATALEYLATNGYGVIFSYTRVSTTIFRMTMVARKERLVDTTTPFTNTNKDFSLSIAAGRGVAFHPVTSVEFNNSGNKRGSNMQIFGLK